MQGRSAVPLNAQAARVLERLAATGAAPVVESTIGEARRNAWVWSEFMGDAEPVADVRHRFIPGPTAELPVAVYTPRGGAPRGAIVYFHGGGWVLGNIDLADRPHRALANATGCVVVAVNYQKAPEHRFPTACDDALAAFDWAMAHADELGVDPATVGVGGDSAGGNLAASLALQARDRADRAPAFQLLVYPVLDPALDTGSAIECAEGFGLSTQEMRWYWQQYLAAPRDADDAYASPLRATDLVGVAPAVVVTVELDPLRDEGRRYADRLEAAGVRVVRHDYPGTIHGILWMGDSVDEYRRLLRDLAGGIDSLLPG
jgi:acetyl esterase